MQFTQWLRANSQRYLLEASQADLARRYLNRERLAEGSGLEAAFWRRVFVPLYQLLPWAFRRRVLQAMPGSHRKQWHWPAGRRPPTV